MKCWLLLPLLFVASCTVLQNNAFMYGPANAGNDSMFVYALPYEKGKAYWVVQGYRSMFSHKGNYAVDFKMKQGTKVFAARDGVVVFAREYFTKGGVSKKYVGTGNGISIRHSDDTYAHYWHLQHNGVLVKTGDSVKRGQHIGFSGSTGFSAFPHLHFEVSKKLRKGREDIPVLFQTKRGPKFLLPLRRYKAV